MKTKVESFMEIFKYQSLGNDYLIFLGNNAPDSAAKFYNFLKNFVVKICDRHFGIGSDGLLYGYALEKKDHFRLKIFNPDGSIAEKSGNGVRIFAQFLFDHVEGVDGAVTVVTDSGDCFCEKQGDKICVDMGNPSFREGNIPFPNERIIEFGGERFKIFCVSIGNPHCVVFLPKENLLTENDVKCFGPHLERLEIFPQRANVQFACVVSPGKILAQIWERGAGYTLASGSSACAIFAAAYAKNLCKREIVVSMPGGDLMMKFSAKNTILQYGEATQIARCWIKDDTR